MLYLEILGSLIFLGIIGLLIYGIILNYQKNKKEMIENAIFIGVCIIMVFSGIAFFKLITRFL